jgi:type II secretory pathway pseudopilin PulG
MRNGRQARPQSGYTYVAMLLAVAAIGIGLAAAGIVWSQASQRAKERELLFVGDQFRRAIERYYERSPGVKRYPAALADLVSDKRFPSPERHLRRIYSDPLTGKAEWTLIEAPGGGIMGVKSTSNAVPIKNAAFARRDRTFEGAKTYQEWEFFHDAQATFAPAGSPLPPPLPLSGAAGSAQVPATTGNSITAAERR